jgi:hypothetical protein
MEIQPPLLWLEVKPQICLYSGQSDRRHVSRAARKIADQVAPRRVAAGRNPCHKNQMQHQLMCAVLFCIFLLARPDRLLGTGRHTHTLAEQKEEMCSLAFSLSLSLCKRKY